jgi:mono/diheme cytochrome c family protein
MNTPKKGRSFMRKALRWLGIGVGAVIVLALLFAAWVWFASWRVLSRTHEAGAERLAAPTAVQLADGARQLHILGCANCHASRLEGGMMFDAGPFAKVWAPNLTELAARVSDQQLAAAIRQGIGHDGRALFIMPSPMYSRLSDQEVAALIAAIRTAPRVGERVSGIQWGPIGRYALATGGMPSVIERIEEFRTRQPYDPGPATAAGRRIAATVCSECHGADLSGGQPTPDISAPSLAIAGAYDLPQFTRLMRTGRPPNGRDLGLMREVSELDLKYLNDAEIAALFAYLQARAQHVPQ